jgi:malonyl CoA-acyl carrier protein transacylase
MFFEQRQAVPDTVAALREEYATDLAAAVETVGVEAAAERTGVDEDRLVRLTAGELPALSFEEAAAVQALHPDAPDADTVAEMAADHLLLGMSMAVLDVDALAGGIDLDLDPKEVQQKLERRAPMTFAEFVAMQSYVVGRQ